MERSSNFEVKGYFPDKDCIIVDPSGNIVAQIGVKKRNRRLDGKQESVSHSGETRDRSGLYW
ncbi:hypothetical protein CUMW_053380 [Citrus unshiu]|nr:hypothetical protein CUMW_053380 [Citrus unshiu]